MAKKNAKPAEPAENLEETNAEAAKPAEPAKKPFSMTPLEEARLTQFKRMFPRECALLIAEHDANK